MDGWLLLRGARVWEMGPTTENDRHTINIQNRIPTTKMSYLLYNNTTQLARQTPSGGGGRNGASPSKTDQDGWAGGRTD